jgi:hypothetical protein
LCIRLSLLGGIRSHDPQLQSHLRQYTGDKTTRPNRQGQEVSISVQNILDNFPKTMYCPTFYPKPKGTNFLVRQF